MRSSIMKSKLNKKPENGYILIELALVMIVLSSLIAVSIPLYNSFEQRNAKAETQQRMDIIAKAFSTYAQTRWRLPCPAESNAAAGDQLGVERVACAANIPDAHGIVPYRTLGIPEQYAKDGYGNFFTYVVSPVFTVDNRLGVQADSVSLRQSHLVSGDNTTGNYALLPRSQFCAPINTSIVNITSDIEANQDGSLVFGIPRDNIAAITRITTATPSANLDYRDLNVAAIAMSLVSHGENSTGAYQANGNRSAASPVGSAEEITSNNNNRIVETLSQWNSNGTNDYDDIVTFYTQSDIFAAAGKTSCEHL